MITSSLRSDVRNKFYIFLVKMSLFLGTVYIQLMTSMTASKPTLRSRKTTPFYYCNNSTNFHIFFADTHRWKFATICNKATSEPS